MNWLFKLADKFGLPSWLAALVGYLLFVLAGIGFIYGIYYNGKLDERADWQAKEQREDLINIAAFKQLAQENKALTALSASRVEAAKQVYQLELQHEKANFNRTLADVRSGAKRLSVATKAVPACNGGVSTAATSGPQNATETRAELSQEAADNVVRFGSEIDKIVIEGNYAKDLYLNCEAHVEALRAQNAGTDLTTEIQLKN